MEERGFFEVRTFRGVPYTRKDLALHTTFARTTDYFPYILHTRLNPPKRNTVAIGSPVALLNKLQTPLLPNPRNRKAIANPPPVLARFCSCMLLLCSAPTALSPLGQAPDARPQTCSTRRRLGAIYRSCGCNRSGMSPWHGSIPVVVRERLGIVQMGS